MAMAPTVLVLSCPRLGVWLRRPQPLLFKYLAEVGLDHMSEYGIVCITIVGCVCYRGVIAGIDYVAQQHTPGKKSVAK